MQRSVWAEVSVALALAIPAWIVGGTGRGKSAILRGMATELGFEGMVVIDLPKHTPEDFGGYAMPGSDGYLEEQLRPMLKPAFEQATLVIFEEVSRVTSPRITNALLNLIQERACLDRHFHPSTRIAACWNPADTDSGCGEVLMAFINRGATFELGAKLSIVEREAYLDYLGGGKGAAGQTIAVPDDWGDHLDDARRRMSAVFRTNPDILYDEPGANEPDRKGQPYPTLRSWEFGERIIAACWIAMNDGDLTQSLLGRVVGRSAAAGMMAGLRDLSIDPAKTLAAADQFVLPDRPDKIFATIRAVVDYARSRARTAILDDDMLAAHDWYTRTVTVLVSAAEQGAVAMATEAMFALSAPSNDGTTSVLPPKGWDKGAKAARVFAAAYRMIGLTRSGSA